MLRFGEAAIMDRRRMLGTGRGGGRGTTRPLPLPPRSFLAPSLLLFFFFSGTGVGLCHGRDDAGVKVGIIKCIETERKALLAVRADIGDADTWLSSWERDDDDDCCRWEGVGCDTQSGHVVKLDLGCPYSYVWPRNQSESKVSPSLLHLTSLRHLDLSFNDFGGARIPSFMGSLVHLEYLNLSYAGFAGSIPPQLGSLQNLHSLDLSRLYTVEVENLHWLPHLSHLQYLDMSGVNLSAVTDWLQVVNMLPSLSVLRLSDSRLPNLPTTLPHINFTSLSTLDLSENYFNSTWPLWSFNISSLIKLDLGFNLHGPIPDGFQNMRHLEVLSLEGNDFEGVIPGSLWTLHNLKALYLSGHNLRIGLSEHMEKLSNLQELELEGVIGRFPDSLGHIVNLRRLVLWDSTIELPESLGNLSRLESLGLYHSNITGGLAESLGKLAKLRDIIFSGNPINGGIPETLGNVSCLESLTLSSNDIAGGLLESLGNLVNLKYLDLSGNNIGRPIPESIGNLSRLESLTLDSNNITGMIPESLGNLVNLKTLLLFRGNLSRELLRNIGHLCNLTELTIQDSIGDRAEVTELVQGLSQCTGGSVLESLDLRGNGFGGHLPDQVGQLSNLKSLWLSGNNLTGLVPGSIGKLSNLSSLDISSNSFEGVLSEAHFTNLSRLYDVDMSYNAALSLNFSWASVPPFQLSSFKMRACNLGPQFSIKWLQTQKYLNKLDLSANVIRDTLADNFFNSFPSMFYLNLSHNQIEASQLHLHSASYLFALDLSNNLISGPIFVSTGEFQVGYLDLSHNSMNGSIPSSICQIKSLQVLDFSYNNFSGEIPGCWEGNSLMVMKLSHNKLLGLIPSSLGTLLQLASLHLDKNNFTGVIPSSLKYCRQLVTLDFGENKLSGEIPTWLGESLSSLQVLRLRSNMFHGNVPMSLSQLQSLQILDLASNRLSGTFLLSFHNLSAMIKIEKAYEPLLRSSMESGNYTFEESIVIVPKGNELEYTTTLSLVTIIDLSSNNLSGHIPKEITSLKGLRFLNLSRNHLEGEIPTNISTMPILESLDLSFNQLSGNIPLSISNMNFLSHFNVSYNNLSGKIPSGSQLQTFDQSTYIGNPDLCGFPLLRPCPNDVTSQDPIFQASEEHEDKHESSMIWLYMGMGTGFAVSFWGFLGVLLLMENKRVVWFRFIDYVTDELYVMVVIHIARLKLKISSWIQTKFVN